MKLNRRLLAASIASLAFAAPLASLAQSGYPNKPIRVIVPFAAGSTTDIIARAIADKMSQSMGQHAGDRQPRRRQRHHRPGGRGQAAPDGYTIMIHSSSHTVSPSTFAKLPFDTAADFAGVTPISTHAQRAGDLARRRTSRPCRSCWPRHAPSPAA